MLDSILRFILDGRYDVDEDFANTHSVTALVGSANKVYSVGRELDSLLVHKMAYTGGVRVDESLKLRQSFSSGG